LHDQILDQMAHFVVHESGANRSAHSEAFAKTPRRVVFTTPFPSRETARRADAALAWIKTKHDLAEGKLIKGAFRCRSNR
jgi:hypothetical protein